ncbi:MAG: TetR/AcrR family transcriptional regulator [Abditibacteriota bacterium]|nr:TetR/AcrR family transcriptional regulator [Abditibacteriota bacterium]
MFKGTPELIEERREEIVNACERLYREKSFKEITLKDISAATSFSRPTVYNYFRTKEEIFLALFEREYDRWNEDLTAMLRCGSLTGAGLADRLAGSLTKREQLLKLLSMNNYDMEANSRQELLTSFKVSYGASMQNVGRLLRKFCPDMSEAEIQDFIYVFFPFMFGIYPYTAVTDKQKTAMKQANVDYRYSSVYEIVRGCLRRLLGV